jgi:hypothetical protein
VLTINKRDRRSSCAATVTQTGSRTAILGGGGPGADVMAPLRREPRGRGAVELLSKHDDCQQL